MLTVYKGNKGNYVVRSEYWACAFNFKGETEESFSNCIAIFRNKKDADEYASFKNSKEDDLK